MSLVLTERIDGVVRLTLNRPDVLNAFNLDMARALQEALDHAASDHGVRAVILTGAGRGFCAGQDLASVDMSPGAPPVDLTAFIRDQYNPVVTRLREMPKPVICAVNGVAAGAGANIALACDIVVAAVNASFIQSFAKIGLVPDSGGTWTLPRLVGHARATALMLLGDKLPAEIAQEWGLIWGVHDAAHLQAGAMELATRLASQPTRALALTKQLLNASSTNDLATQLALEERLQGEAGRSADFTEGVRAFLEKRAPNFTGR
ncbi:MAG: 2-(1,2-epoxy-1,2-dihydrophenyl)acetyl-CoA isomerase [Gemmatimonadetes bacterium]|nr:2-(1,2-epoxy-1,2-dihydrophenyl)acetyl-CoA isomerase [Gemmatimonadota bacterium]